LRTGDAELEAVYHVVQAPLQDLQQSLARNTLGLGRHLVVPPKLALQHAVDAAQLLLLLQVQGVIRRLPPPLPVLTGRVGPPGHGALVAVALVTFEVKLLARPPAETANGAGVRSEEHTSELQSRENLVCRLLLEHK